MEDGGDGEVGGDFEDGAFGVSGVDVAGGEVDLEVLGGLEERRLDELDLGETRGFDVG